MKQTAEVASKIQAEKQGSGTPHYDEIEIPAHEVGQQLSRMIQATRNLDVATGFAAEVDCPTCGQTCGVKTDLREIGSMDGPVELTENVAHCRRCRRSFFPSA
ncbi:MAG TPA: hypothetical protein EYP31_06725 [Roseibacterium sp.]|nr:hypothetical protein [Roseibacterium sp.]